MDNVTGQSDMTNAMTRKQLFSASRSDCMNLAVALRPRIVAKAAVSRQRRLNQAVYHRGLKAAAKMRDR